MAEWIPQAHKQDDDATLDTLEQAVDLTDNAEIPPVSSTQSSCQHQQPFLESCTRNQGSQMEMNRLGTRLDASSQTNHDSVHESMSEVTTQLERTRNLLGVREVRLTAVFTLSHSVTVQPLCANTGGFEAVNGAS